MLFFLLFAQPAFAFDTGHYSDLTVVSSHNNTGNITGVHDSPTNTVTSQGNKPDSDRAIVQFYVTERPL